MARAATGSATDSETKRRALENELSAALRSSVHVAFSRSRRHSIQCRRTRRGRGADAHVEYDLRLAPFFAAADASVRQDLATWITHGRRARVSHDRLMAWIDSRWAQMPARAVPRSGLNTSGVHHDLARLADELRSLPSAEALGRLRAWPAIGYGRWPNRAPRHSLRLGSYEHERRWVRIHPVLDSAEVPSWFVRYVLFHELLHAVSADEGWDGGAAHGPTFRRFEAGLADSARAHAWQHEHTVALLDQVRRHLRRTRSARARAL